MTNFHKKLLEEMGFQSNYLNIYKNPIKNNLINQYNHKSKSIVYAGRLGNEKGIEELLTAWNESNMDNLTLKIIGAGPLLDRVSSKYSSTNVEFLGPLDHETTLAIIKQARGVVTATKMFEGQPRLLCEASVNGVPSLFPDFGGMVEFFPENYILKFKQFDYKNLTKKLHIFKDEEQLLKISIDITNHINTIFDKKALKN